MRPQSKLETEGLVGVEGPGSIGRQERNSATVQTLGIYSWKQIAGNHQEGLSLLGRQSFVGDSGCSVPRLQCSFLLGFVFVLGPC